MSVQITFSELWTYGTDTFRRLPLSSLPHSFGHVHGRLSIKIGDRELPYLGHWGPDDVCLWHWAQQLAWAVETLSTSLESDYVYDEGEQGQPAFRFSRRGDTVYVSVIASEISDGVADPDWQDVPCSFEDLKVQVENLLNNLHETIKVEAPSVAKQWRPSQLRRRISSRR
jgi:hypothetical protein